MATGSSASMLHEKCHAKSCGTNARCSNPLTRLQAEKTTTTVSQIRRPLRAPTSGDHGRNLLPTARSRPRPPRDARNDQDGEVRRCDLSERQRDAEDRGWVDHDDPKRREQVRAEVDARLRQPGIDRRLCAAQQERDAQHDLERHRDEPEGQDRTAREIDLLDARSRCHWRTGSPHRQARSCDGSLLSGKTLTNPWDMIASPSRPGRLRSGDAPQSRCPARCQHDRRRPRRRRDSKPAEPSAQRPAWL